MNTNDTVEIQDFSIIKFPGIPKKVKQKLRAMKKPSGLPPPPSSFLSKFLSPLKKDENPPPKEMKLTNNKYTYNKITKTYEFEGDEQVKTEEFQPPPTKFLKTEKNPTKKLYVDVMGSDNKVTNIDVVDENNTYEHMQGDLKDNLLQSILFNQETPEVLDKSQEFNSNNKLEHQVYTLQSELEYEKNKNKMMLSAIDLNCIITEYVPYDVSQNYGVSNTAIELEKENLSLNLLLSEKSLEILHLNERILSLENQNSELVLKIEWNETEKNGIFNNFHQENSQLLENLKLAYEKNEKTEKMIKTKTLELKKIIEKQKSKENIILEARVRSEINEKKALIRENQLEKDYNWAVNVIKVLEQTIKSLQEKNFQMIKELNSPCIDNRDLIAIIKLSSSYFKLQNQFKDLREENNCLKSKEFEYLQAISSLEETSRKARQSIKQESDLEINKIKSKYQTEAIFYSQEISKLKLKVNELLKSNFYLNSMEKDLTLANIKLLKENEVLRNDNFEYQKIEDEFYQKELLNKQFLEEINEENQELKREIKHCKVVNQDLQKKTQSVETANANLTETLKSVEIEHDKKLSETTKKYKIQINQLKDTINTLENSSQALVDQNACLSTKIQELEQSTQSITQDYKDQVQSLIESHQQELLKLTQDNNLNIQEISILKESTQTEIDSLHKKLEKQKFLISELEKEIGENCEIRNINHKLNEEVRGLGIVVDELKSNIHRTNQLANEYQSENQGLNGKFTELEFKFIQLENNYSQVSENLKKAQSDQVQLQETYEKLSEDYSEVLESKISLENTLKQLQADNTALKTDLEALSNNYNALEIKYKETTSASESLEDTKKDLINLQQECQDLSSKVQVLQLENEALLNAQQTIQSIDAQYKTLEKSFAEEQIKYKNLSDEFNVLSEENIRMYEQLNNAEASLSQSEATIEGMKIELEDKIQKINEDYGIKLNNQSYEFNFLLEKAKQELELEKNLKSKIFEDFNQEKTMLIEIQQENSEKIENLTQKYEEAKQIIENLNDQINRLEQEDKTAINTDLNKEFTNSDPDFFSIFNQKDENSLLGHLQTEKWELEAKLQAYEEEKINYEQQIESLNKEIDGLYEKNLTLMNQNQVLITDQKRKQDSNITTANLKELEKKLKEKDEEIQLIKQNFQELVQNSVKDPKKNDQTTEKGWVSSVLGSIFLTDKERG
jgi:hypothetical protein